MFECAFIQNTVVGRRLEGRESMKQIGKYAHAINGTFIQTLKEFTSLNQSGNLFPSQKRFSLGEREVKRGTFGMKLNDYL